VLAYDRHAKIIAKMIPAKGAIVHCNIKHAIAPRVPKLECGKAIKLMVFKLLFEVAGFAMWVALFALAK
jgi:hypothetical protein